MDNSESPSCNIDPGSSRGTGVLSPESDQAGTGDNGELRGHASVLRSVVASLAAVDPVVNHLSACLLPALENPAVSCRQFIDHLSRAMQAHMAFKYGAVRTASHRGGLAPWQERLAKELLMARLEGEVDIAKIALRCELSLGHFARAFKQSTGSPPHQWLMDRRVEKSQGLLLQGKLPIAEIAMASGFADQSHFTRIFSRRIGMSPAAWRRNNRGPGPGPSPGPGAGSSAAVLAS